MEVAMPMSGTTSAMDCYEDMFKEITRKLYGEEGLPELSSNDRVSGGSAPNDYDMDTPIFKTEEHITAFGLAALMQNGFQTAGILNSNYQPPKPVTTNLNLENTWIISEDSLQWTQSKIASYNPHQKLFRCAECDCVGYLARVAEHWLGTHSNLRVFQCPQCPYTSAWARCVRMHLTRNHNIDSEDTTETLLKENPVLHEISRFLQRLKTRLESNCVKTQVANHTVGSGGVEDFSPSATSVVPRPQQQNLPNTSTETLQTNKRYSCTYCPYATDRRDLFTRHENIHREEKPFQCYVCQKQFNRADHVKKHFLRMHREHPYDLNRIRRHPPKNASGMSYYHKYNANGSGSSSSDVLPNSGIQHTLTIPNSFGNMNRMQPRLSNSPDIKSNKPSSPSKSSSKKKGDKRYSCCYCSWSGVDNWCLKRHLNTHLKPFVCALCDYKAARSERLATHVLKVHNKRACGRCMFLADDQVQLTSHQQEHHPLEQRNNRSGSTNTLRNATVSTNSIAVQTTSYGHGSMTTASFKSYELSAAAALLQHGGRLLPMSTSILPNSECKSWKPYTPKQHGAARLFNYMEASDGSDLECDAVVNTSANDNRMQLNNNRTQSDFHEAGDVGNAYQGDAYEDECEEIELPLFICRECGCEFVDDASLETHQFTLHRTLLTASPAKVEKGNNETIKENVNPIHHNYTCSICDARLKNQSNIIKHMVNHATINYDDHPYNGIKAVEDIAQKISIKAAIKRSRKQRQPKKVIVPFWDNEEIQVLRRVNGKLRNLRNSSVSLLRLSDKHLAHLITRKGLSCNWCRNSKNGPMFPYHRKGSLALHFYWRHSRKNKFRCEHCYMSFKHCYQVVLHSSRVHVRKQATSLQKSDSMKQIVPKFIKEPIVRNSSVPGSEFTSHNFLHMPAVPDTNNAHKLAIPTYFDHTFIHSSNHMPIVIPTFPPT